MRLLAILLVGCVATRAPKLAERPRWLFKSPAAIEAGCAIGDAWIRKSGKQGFGVAIRLRSVVDCRVELASIRLTFAGGGTVAVASPDPIVLHGRSLVYAWLPVRFDNDAAWDDERNDATLEVAVIANGATTPWAMHAVQW